LSVAAVLLISFFISGCGKGQTVEDQPAAWEQSGGLITTGQYRAVAVADLDNDGNLDVIGGSDLPGTVAVWYGDGRGGFPAYQFLPVKADVRSISVADIDKDGLLDLVFSVQREALGIMVWMNQLDRKWKQGFGPDQVKSYENLQTADINRDGFQDIIAANATEKRDAGIQVWFGDGKGNWPMETGPTNEGLYMDVALSDFNNDGNIDLAGSGWGTDGALRIWLGNGTGGWSSTAPLKKGSFYALSTADINGDGSLDILAGSYRMGIQIFLGDGTGKFKNVPSPTAEGSFWKVLPLDLNEDGKLDLISGSIEDKGLKAWTRQGENSWAPVSGRFPSKGIYYDMTISDIDRDNRSDLFTANYGEGIKLWSGQGGAPAAGPGTGTIRVKQIPATEALMGVQSVQENDVFTTVDGLPQYKIGPGDVLELTTWRGTQGNREEITVRSDGKISFAFIEDLYVSGLTIPHLDELLRKELKAFIKNPRIDVVVKRHNSKLVTLSGSIQSVPYTRTGPGQYALTGKTTLLEMLNIAGGPTNDANLNRVRIRRKDGRSFVIDLFKVIIQGDASQDIVLDAGDIVMVPSVATAENRVYVFGEVTNPGLFTFTGRDIRIFDVISRAGDVTIFAKRTQTRVVRGDIARPEIIPVDLTALLERGDQTQNIALQNGDFVYVPRTFLGDANRFLNQIRPLIDLALEPARIRDTYSEADRLRITNLP